MTRDSSRRTSLADEKRRSRQRRDAASDETYKRLRRTGQIDLRSNVREPRKSHHAAGALADIMVDALNSEATSSSASYAS
jgi:hypothetical protein